MRPFVILLTLACAGAARAPQDDPVTWSATAATKGLRPGGAFEVAITAVADEEWHVYSVTQGPGGPVPTTIALARSPLFSRHGPVRGPEPVTAFDPNFEIKTETYDGTFTLALPVRLAAGATGTAATLRLEIGFQACTNRLCLPPQTISLAVPVQVGIGDQDRIGGNPLMLNAVASLPISCPASRLEPRACADLRRLRS